MDLSDLKRPTQQDATPISSLIPSEPAVYDISEQPIARITVPSAPSHPFKDRFLYLGVSAIVWVLCPIMMIVMLVMIARALN